MEIRKCLDFDINEVYNLVCELKDKKLDFNMFQKAYRSKISNKNNYLIIGIENNNVVGFLSLVIDYQLHHTGKVGTVEELIVSSKYRNNGIGRVLLENAINYAKETKCDVIELTSGFTRVAAHRFYEKNGFIKGSYKFKKKL